MTPNTQPSISTATPAALTAATKPVDPVTTPQVATPSPAPKETAKTVEPEVPASFKTANSSQPVVSPQVGLDKEATAKAAEHRRMFLLGYI